MLVAYTSSHLKLFANPRNVVVTGILVLFLIEIGLLDNLGKIRSNLYSKTGRLLLD